MATINLYSNIVSPDTVVPNIFIDRYMPLANGEFVKIYLYLLRTLSSSDHTISVSSIADHFEQTEKDVMRAFNYWTKEGLLRIDTDAQGNVTGLTLLPVEISRADAASAQISRTDAASAQICRTDAASTEVSGSNKNIIASYAKKPAPQKQARREYSLDEIKHFRSDPDISELFFIIETYLKHPMSSSDTNIILYWLDKLKFSPELVTYLVEYCISKGHSSLRYMDKVALGWADSGISTVEQAKNDSAAHSKAYYAVTKALGITGRNLIQSEIDFINKWNNEYNFTIELINEACKRTISATHQPSFEYTDTILTNWYRNNVHNMNDVSRLDQSFSKNKQAASRTAENVTKSRHNKFNNFDQRTQDYDQLEKLLLNS